MRPGRRLAMSDPEIDAMETIAKALGGLDEQQVARVLRWALDRHGISMVQTSSKGNWQRTGTPDGMAVDERQFPDLAGLYNAANPRSEAEKALVAGYWFQQVRRQSDFEGQQANTELKQLGHGIANITQKPRLVMQTHKSGRAKQARKKYRLTTEGLRYAENMLSSIKPEEE
jgi:hypothetical protein